MRKMFIIVIFILTFICGCGDNKSKNVDIKKQTTPTVSEKITSLTSITTTVPTTEVTTNTTTKKDTSTTIKTNNKNNTTTKKSTAKKTTAKKSTTPKKTNNSKLQVCADNDPELLEYLKD